MRHVRDLPALWPFRQRRHVVVVCLDDPAGLLAARAEIEARGAALVVEARAGPLSAALGRPSLTVADRFGTVTLCAPAASAAEVLAELDAFELSCPECGPKAWGGARAY
ncbi:MAG TPA: hypothetical protein VK915_08345 [Gaiellaceae bacterium]|nr:hypothetical protein [Gaiellaceae bacterium]